MSMRLITTVVALLAFFTLAACGEKADYEKQAEKDAAARRIVNTGEK
jgi:predicted small lipoprotein YifL